MLISKGLEQGYLTYAEVNDHLPDDIVDPEQIEDIIGMINGMGIEVHEVAPDAETLLLAGASASGREVDDTAAEEAAAALTALDTEGGRTTDPVRMYMREMGTVELLTREGEIAIAKRIEEGLNQVQASLASFPWSIQLLLEDYELHKAGKKRLAEIVVGFIDLRGAGRRPSPAWTPPPPPRPRPRTRKTRPTTAMTTKPTTPARPVRIRPKSRAAWRRWPTLYAKFQKAYAKHGPGHKTRAQAARGDGRDLRHLQAAAGR